MATTTPWLTESLRLSVFSAAHTVDVTAADWWKKLTGDEPETQTFQKNTPLLHVHGPIENGTCNLGLDVQVGRIDWTLTPIIPDAKPIETFPSFGKWEQALVLYKRLFSQWINAGPAFSRMAIGVVLINPVNSRSEGYNLIQSYLPSVTLDVEASSDFFYMINRPRNNAVINKTLKANRLSKWSVASFAAFSIQINVGQKSVGHISDPGQYACRVELDVSSSEDNKDLIDGHTGQKLFSELADLTVELAEKGDIP